MPSRRHELLARVVPRLRRSQDLDSVEAERERIVRWHATLERELPTGLATRFGKRYSVVTEVVSGPAGEFPAYVLTPRGTDPHRTLLYLHGGGYVAGIDPFHVRFLASLASGLGVRVVLPDYPLAPEHTWRDSHEALADLATRWAKESDELLLAGDSAGGGYALALALTLRERGGPQAGRMVLLSPWVDLTTSTPESEEHAARDPWLHLGKLRAYAAWWAGSAEDLGRPEVSPALADLAGLPSTLMICGTRDTLAPGCRLLARRAAAAHWDLSYVEVPELIHVYPLLPFVPEAREARAAIKEYLR
jgi:epsilon-lactone hydrolase